MKKVLIAGIATFVLAGCAQTTTTNTVVPTAAPTATVFIEDSLNPTGDELMKETTESMTGPWLVTLGEQNDSGQQGTATLEDVDGKTVVTLTMTGTASTVEQPAHIHLGACPNPGAVEYPLTNVVNGKSVTTLDTTTTALKSKMPLAINVHKSATESKVYTSCGDLK